MASGIPLLIIIVALLFILGVSASFYLKLLATHDRAQELASAAQKVAETDSAAPLATLLRPLDNIPWLGPSYTRLLAHCWMEEDKACCAVPIDQLLRREELLPTELARDGTPNLLTAVGLLGTFMGIAYGLGNFNVPEQVEVFSGEIDSLIGSLSASFWTSIFGVFGAAIAGATRNRSLVQFDTARTSLVNALETRLEIRPTQAILSDLNQLIAGQGDTLAVAISKSGLLDSIQDMTVVLTEAIQQTKEHRIEDAVDKLSRELTNAAETTQTLREGFQAEAVAQAALITELRSLSTALQPAISELREAVSELTDKTGTLGEQTEASGARLTEGVRSMTAAQANLSDAVERMSTSLEQGRDMLESTRAVLETTTGTHRELAGTVASHAASVAASGEALHGLQDQLQATCERLQAQESAAASRWIQLAADVHTAAEELGAASQQLASGAQEVLHHNAEHFQAGMAEQVSAVFAEIDTQLAQSMDAFRTIAALLHKEQTR